MTRLVDPEGNEANHLQQLVDFRAARVLEVGCGDGRLTALYAPKAEWVLGIDIKAEELVPALDAQPSGRVAFAVAHAERLPCDSESIDVVLFARSL